MGRVQTVRIRSRARALGTRRILGNKAGVRQFGRSTDRLVLRISAGRTTHMGTIQIRTAIPGPKSKALMERRNAAVARGPFHSTPVFAAKAEGAVIEDVDGN